MVIAGADRAKKIPSLAGTGSNALTKQLLNINTVFKAIMFYSPAIPLGGSTGTEHKCHEYQRGQTKQKLLHTFLKS
jgi:hypothetical protein